MRRTTAPPSPSASHPPASRASSRTTRWSLASSSGPCCAFEPAELELARDVQAHEALNMLILLSPRGPDGFQNLCVHQVNWSGGKPGSPERIHGTPEREPRGRVRAMMPAKTRLFGVVVAILLAGCAAFATPTANPAPALTASPMPTPIFDSQTGMARCTNWMQSAGNYQTEAAFDSTAGVVAAWTENRLGGGYSSPWRAYPSTLVVTVCYLHGEWRPPLAAPPPVPINRGVIFIGANGVTMQGPVGNDQKLLVIRPSA